MLLSYVQLCQVRRNGACASHDVHRHVEASEKKMRDVKGFKIWMFPKIGVFTPQIIHFNRVFYYKPSILGYHYFWKPISLPPLDLLVSLQLIYCKDRKLAPKDQITKQVLPPKPGGTIFENVFFCSISLFSDVSFGQETRDHYDIVLVVWSLLTAVF